METMSNYILGILKRNPFIAMSWGAHSFTSISDNGLSFTVNGFVFKGNVQIVYNDGNDLFNVTVGKEKFTGIYMDELVSFIDRKVEKDCNDNQYEEKVNDWFMKEAIDEFKGYFADEE